MYEFAEVVCQRVVFPPISITADELRVIFQCKHWVSHPIAVREVTMIVNQMSLWTPPPLNELVIVTSGRFTTDAIQWIEKHNFERRNPWIVMCPNSHLELLASA